MRFWCRCPSPSSRGPPDNHSCAFRCLGLVSATLAPRACDIECLLVMGIILYAVVSGPSSQINRVGQETGQPLWGTSFIMVFCLVLRYGGGSLGGEAFGLSVPRSLITTLQRVGAAHGPRHPGYFSQSCSALSWICICFCKLFAL